MNAQNCRALVLAPRASRGSRSSGARVAGAATGGAGMMPELSPVPVGPCRGPWRERRHRTVPTCGRSVGSFFRMRPFLSQLLMQRATCQPLEYFIVAISMKSILIEIGLGVADREGFCLTTISPSVGSQATERDLNPFRHRTQHGRAHMAGRRRLPFLTTCSDDSHVAEP